MTLIRMDPSEVESLVDRLINEGKTIREVVDQLAARKVYYRSVEIALEKRYPDRIDQVIALIRSHEFFVNQSMEYNPFNDYFIKIVRDNENPS